MKIYVTKDDWYVFCLSSKDEGYNYDTIEISKRLYNRYKKVESQYRNLQKRLINITTEQGLDL